MLESYTNNKNKTNKLIKSHDKATYSHIKWNKKQHCKNPLYIRTILSLNTLRTEDILSSSLLILELHHTTFFRTGDNLPSRILYIRTTQHYTHIEPGTLNH